MYSFCLKGNFFDFLDFFMCDIQYCFICRPSDSIVSEDARIEPRTVATTALAVRRSNHSASSHPQTRMDLIHQRINVFCGSQSYAMHWNATILYVQILRPKRFLSLDFTTSNFSEQFPYVCSPCVVFKFISMLCNISCSRNILLPLLYS